MSARKGFTLIELLVAMTLFSVVMTAVYGAFSTGAQVWRLGERDTQVFQDARVALTLMSKELRCSFAEAGHLFLGEDDRSGDRENDRLEFYTVRPPLEPGEDREARILKVSYYVDEAPGGRGYVLKREEEVVTGSIPTEKETAARGKRERPIEMDKPWRCILAANVDSLDFHYSWGEQWVPVCKKGFGMPGDIRIVLKLRGEGKRSEIRRFDTAVHMPLKPGKGPPKEGLR